MNAVRHGRGHHIAGFIDRIVEEEEILVRQIPRLNRRLAAKDDILAQTGRQRVVVASAAPYIVDVSGLHQRIRECRTGDRADKLEIRDHAAMVEDGELVIPLFKTVRHDKADGVWRRRKVD